MIANFEQTVENFLSTLSGIGDSISMVIQYIIHGIKSLLLFLSSLVKAVVFVIEALTFLPAWFAVIVGVVLSVVVVKLLIPGGD